MQTNVFHFDAVYLGRLVQVTCEYTHGIGFTSMGEEVPPFATVLYICDKDGSDVNGYTKMSAPFMDNSEYCRIERDAQVFGKHIAKANYFWDPMDNTEALKSLSRTGY